MFILCKWPTGIVKELTMPVINKLIYYLQGALYNNG